MTKIANQIAYKGMIVLDKAIWDIAWGMYATFELEQRPHEKEHANPFKRFTKMRKGRVGTMFSAVIVPKDSEDPIYEQDVMLKGWTDGTTGWKVTFWVNADPNNGGHPFLNCKQGDEFALVVIELDDDSAPIDQVKREKLERATAKKKSGGKLSNFAAQLCRSTAFICYIKETHPDQVWRDLGQTWTEIVPNWMYLQCGITSRAELDSNPEKAELFHERIRLPFAAWMEHR